MSEILKNIKSRISTRAFLEKPIEKEKLDTILEAAIYAPSARNLQSWQFTVLTDKDKIGQIAKVVGVALGNENYNFYCPPVFVLASNDRENKNGYADCSCALQNMFLMANDLGIGSCWINQLKDTCDQPEVRNLLKEFGLPDNHVVWGAAALGYAKEEGKPKERNRAVIKFVS